MFQSFKVTPPADVADALAQIRIETKATDDMSGVSRVTFGIVGPHGQRMYAAAYGSMPTKKLDQRTVADSTPYLEPGTWAVDSIDFQDAAGNWAGIWDPAAIAAAGNAQFTVVNTAPNGSTTRLRA